ncbi:hypothetical protein F4776DRAFT_458192 [Hypoxylon sp. NC0597]|nr:hypothetical protein F4776DRAFT_458192 [Hypoxylon sp. NC0597]
MQDPSPKTRARVVCIRCHDRKVRCDLSSRQGDTCRHCQQDRAPCRIYVGARRKRLQSRVAAPGRFAENVSNTPALNPESSADIEGAGLAIPNSSNAKSITLTAIGRLILA